MTVQIIENWTHLEGEVQSVVPSPDVANYIVADIRVRRADPVEGFANLLTGVVGSVVPVHVASEVAKKVGLGAGTQFHGRVRRGGPHRNFADPHSLRVP